MVYSQMRLIYYILSNLFGSTLCFANQFSPEYIIIVEICKFTSFISVYELQHSEFMIRNC